MTNPHVQDIKAISERLASGPHDTQADTRAAWAHHAELCQYVDALAAERDALIAYARYLEDAIDHAGMGYRPEAGRHNHNVSHLLDRP